MNMTVWVNWDVNLNSNSSSIQECYFKYAFLPRENETVYSVPEKLDKMVKNIPSTDEFENFVDLICLNIFP